MPGVAGRVATASVRVRMYRLPPALTIHLIILVPAGCSGAPRFTAGRYAPVAAVYAPAGATPQGLVVDDIEAALAGETDASESYSHFAARNLLPGADPSGEPAELVAFMEWLFGEGDVDLEAYVEYLEQMSFEEMVAAALTSVSIPLGRNTTAELSLGIVPAGGLAFPGTVNSGPPEGGEPTEPAGDEAGIFEELESVFIGLDLPLPGRIRSRLAIDYYYSWPSEADPDVERVEYGEWTVKLRYRAWFW